MLNFRRIAVTEKQIDEYNYHQILILETKAKMIKDTRTANFERKYGKLIAVELDALPAIIPVNFRNLVFDSVYSLSAKDISK